MPVPELGHIPLRQERLIDKPVYMPYKEIQSISFNAALVVEVLWYCTCNGVVLCLVPVTDKPVHHQPPCPSPPALLPPLIQTS